MNDTIMTIIGNVVDVPVLRRTREGGHPVANFRVASTPRRYDRDQGAWIDGHTLFVNVSAWRALALNVADSLRKGQPVVVTGRYQQREYTQGEQVRVAYDLEATAVGHDLTRGVATFERIQHTPAPAVEVDDEGNPADRAVDYLDLEETAPTDVDGQTGEVRELSGV